MIPRRICPLLISFAKDEAGSAIGMAGFDLDEADNGSILTASDDVIIREVLRQQRIGNPAFGQLSRDVQFPRMTAKSLYPLFGAHESAPWPAIRVHPRSSVANGSSLLPMLQRRFHELPKQRMGAVGAGFELRVELAADEERVVGELDHLDQVEVGVDAGDD